MKRSTAKTSIMLGFEFGVLVEFRRILVPGRLGEVHSVGQNAVFVGYNLQNGDYVLVKDDEAYKTKTLKILPVADRLKQDPVDDIQWRRWKI